MPGWVSLVIDRETLNALRNLNLKELQYELRHHLTRDELTALESRYHKLLEHAEALESRDLVIDDWKSWSDSQGRNIYQHLVDAEAEREALKNEHSTAARRVSGRHRLKSVYHQNLATTMELGIATSYLANLLRLGRR